MAIDAGDITYSITVDTKDMIDAKRDVNQFNKGLKDTGKEVDFLKSKLTTLATTMAGVFAVNNLSAFIAQTVNAISTQKDFADSISVSFEQLQRLQFVAKKAGVDIDTFNDALQEMVIKFEEAGSGANEDIERRLERIGINISEILALSPDQAFLKFSDAMGNLASSTEKVSLANDLYGDSGVKMLNIMNQGSDAIRKQMMELDALGGVLSNEAAQGYKDFKNSVSEVGTALNAVATQGMAQFSDEMKAISDVVKDFVSDSEKVESVLNGIGIAAQATAVIITSRLVSSFVALVAKQAATVATSIAAAKSIQAVGTASTIAAVGTTKMTAAAIGLRAALGFLGGPVGIAAAVITSLLLLNNTQDDLAESTGELEKKVDQLTVKYRALSQIELSKEIEKSKEGLSDVSKEMDKVIKRISEFENKAKGGSVSISEIIANDDDLQRLKELRNETDKYFQAVSAGNKVSGENNLRKSVSDALSSISKAGISEKQEIAIEDIFKFSAMKSTAGLEGKEKIDAEAKVLKDEVMRAFKEISPDGSQIAVSFEDVEKSITKAYEDSIKGITDPAALDKIKKVYEARLETSKNFYENLKGEMSTQEEILNAIDADAAAKKKEIADREASELKAKKDELIAIERASTIALMKEKDQVIAIYDDKIKDLKDRLTTEKDITGEIGDAIVALEAEKASRVADIDKKAVEQRQESLRQIEDATARNLINSAEGSEKIILQKEEEIRKLEETYSEDVKNTEEYRQLKLSINEKYDQKEADLAAKKEKEAERLAKAEADRIAKQRKEEEKKQVKQDKDDQAFSDFSESFMEFTPMEMLAKREAEANEKLKELYAESTASHEEYQKALTDIEKTFNKERENLRQDEYAAIVGQTSMLMGATETILDGAAAAIQQAAGENSAAYKAMFALSKGFAVAQAGLNLTLAVSNAMASGPFPWNLGAMASVATAGAGLVSSISGATYGRQNGGDVSSGNMYKVNESGTPEVYSYGNSDYLMSSQNAKVTPMDQYMSQGGMGGSGVSVTIINQMPGAEVTQQQGVSRDEVVFLIKETVPGEISNPNSKTSKALQSSTNANRKLK